MRMQERGPLTVQLFRSFEISNYYLKKTQRAAAVNPQLLTIMIRIMWSSLRVTRNRPMSVVPCKREDGSRNIYSRNRSRLANLPGVSCRNMATVSISCDSWGDVRDGDVPVILKFCLTLEPF